MQILTLTPQTEERLLARRAQDAAETHAIAAKIIADVRRNRDAALFAYAKKFDHTDLRRTGVWITQKEIRVAQKATSAGFRKAIEKAAENVRTVAEKQLPRPWTVETSPGVKIHQVVRPIEAIGCYIPGGQFSLVSTLLMTVVPANVAGVPNVVAVCPAPNPKLLVAAGMLGVERIARIGGAQAIAALAYGTKSVPRVDKIFGPGNKYVTAAKQIVSSDCAIDLPAGPTEAMVFAEQGNARWIAADLLAQAEHAKDAASFFITTSHGLAGEVQREIQNQLAELPGTMARCSTQSSGAILIAESVDQACEFINRFAPEHLSLPENAEPVVQKIHSAGTVVRGPWAAAPTKPLPKGVAAKCVWTSMKTLPAVRQRSGAPWRSSPASNWRCIPSIGNPPNGLHVISACTLKSCCSPTEATTPCASFSIPSSNRTQAF